MPKSRDHSDNSKDKNSAGTKKKDSKKKKTDDEGHKSRGSSSEKKDRKKSVSKSQASEDGLSVKSGKDKKSSKTKKDDKGKKPSQDDDLQILQKKQMDIDCSLKNLQIVAQQQSQDKCVHHDLEFQFFCESCEEPICRQCTIMGPHNNQLHRINRMDESFKARVIRLTETIRQSLIPKRDQLLAQIHRLEYRIEEIRYVKTIIERDARSEYGGVIERLKSAEGVKVAVLQHEMSELQKDLDRINDIGHSFNEFSSDPDRPIPFLLRARNLYENIEFQVAKPFKQNIDVYPYDLPRELTELRLQLQKVHAQKALIEFKNEVIWKLLDEKKSIETKVKSELENAAYQELQEWAKLTEKYSGELKKFYLVCYYCNVQMDENTVNHRCHNNKTQNVDPSFMGHTQKQPEQKFHGNNRHFFARPYDGQPGMNPNQLPNESMEIPTKNFQATKINRNNQQQAIFMETQLEKIRKIVDEEEINLAEIFRKHDKQKNGQVSQIQFQYIMTDILQTSDKEAERIYKFFTSQKEQSMINYYPFFDLMENPEKIEEFLNNQ